jgi:putative alpha-1,2-mannosidase
MLDALFVAPSVMHGDFTSPDASGFIRQYAHGNEPSHHIAYMYSYIGEAWKTQERIRQIIDTMYSDKPDGYVTKMQETVPGQYGLLWDYILQIR